MSTATANRMVEIPTKHIIAPDAGSKVRKVGIDQLADSIKAVGLINPITVRQLAADQFLIIAGRRRYWACVSAGLDTIRCIVLAANQEGHADVIEVTENMHRIQLTPMQEAEAIQKLRKLGHPDESIAADLGMTRQFVARRAKLLDLTKSWKEALTDEGDNIGVKHWPVACLEMIARYPEPRQEEMLVQHGNDSDMTVDELKSYLLEGEAKLGAAIWDLADATLCAAAGACTVCPKRAGAQPLLFSDEADGVIDAKKDTCLDRACFKQKHKAAIERKVKEKLREHPDMVKITEGAARGHTLGYYQYDKAKKEDKGAVPALMVDGPKAGSMTFVKVKKNQLTRTSSGPKQEKTKSPAELAKERDDRRWEIVGQEIARMIEGPRFSSQKKQPDVCRAPGGLLSESEKEITRLKTALALATMGADFNSKTTLAGLSKFVSSAHATPTSALVQMFWKANRWAIAERIDELTLSDEKGPLQDLLKPFLDIANLKFDDLWKIALQKVAEPKAEIAPPAKVQKPKARTVATKPVRSESKGKVRASAPAGLAPFLQLMQPSPELAAIVGDKPLVRTEVTKKLWDYIKKNGLQDQVSRRMINADEKLLPIFGGIHKVSMFVMTKLMAKHLKPAKADSAGATTQAKKSGAKGPGWGATLKSKPKQAAHDPRANAHGVYTPESAGGHFHHSALPVPKFGNLKITMSIDVAEGSDGRFRYGTEFERQVPLAYGKGGAPSTSGKGFPSLGSAQVAGAEDLRKVLLEDEKGLAHEAPSVKRSESYRKIESVIDAFIEKAKGGEETLG